MESIEYEGLTGSAERAPPKLTLLVHKQPISIALLCPGLLRFVPRGNGWLNRLQLESEAGGAGNSWAWTGNPLGLWAEPIQLAQDKSIHCRVAASLSVMGGSLWFEKSF